MPLPRLPTGRYSREKGVPLLQRSAVAFIDLLGTKSRAQGPNAQATLEALDRALRLAREQADMADPDKWFHAVWFSDNLAIAAPLPGDDRAFEEGTLGFVLVALMWLQFRLTIEGFFAKGGVTVGDQFVDDDIMFGPALVEAVDLHRAERFPRVVADHQTLAVVNEHLGDYGDLTDNPFHHELMLDKRDGVVFLSYLAACQEADDVEEARLMLSRHREAVLAQLASDHPPEISEKYAWVADYHDAYCDLHFPQWPELKVSDRQTDRRAFRSYVSQRRSGA